MSPFSATALSAAEEAAKRAAASGAAAANAAPAAPTPTTPEERLALARDPSTPPSVLSALYRAWANTGGDRPDDLGDALAENPNTPPDDLAFLATNRTAAFCRNPVAPLLLLEVPDFVRRLSRFPVPALLRDEHAPVSLVSAISLQSESPEVREEAALHVGLAGEVPDGVWREEARAYLVGRVRDARDDRGGRDSKRELAQRLIAALLAVGIAPAWLAEAVPAAVGVPDALRDPEKARPDVLRRALAPVAPPVCRCFAYAYGVTARHSLEAAGRSLVWLERLGVALNPATVTELPATLDQLAEDGSRLVRAAARARRRGEAGL
jgi:hypothetical protein